MHPLFRLHLLCFPPACRQCGRMMNPLAGEEAGFPYLCGSCRAALPWKTPAFSCRACGSLTAEPDRLRCPVCAERKYAFTRVWCAFSYQDPVRNWVLQFKYHGEESLARMLGRLVREAPNTAAALQDAEVVLPVPLHRRRLRKRGFNQAYLLAHQVLRGRPGAPLPSLRTDLLHRTRHTRPQVELPREAREANVAAAFSLSAQAGSRRLGLRGLSPSPATPGEGPLPNAVEGRNVLLVDDLMTTGATLDACAKVLRQAGAARVEALVLARA